MLIFVVASLRGCVVRQDFVLRSCVRRETILPPTSRQIILALWYLKGAPRPMRLYHILRWFSLLSHFADLAVVSLRVVLIPDEV